MKFLLDHDVPDEIERVLRYWRHDVKRLREVLPVSTADDVIFDFAQVERRVIITCNRNHFLRLAREAFQKARPFAGLIKWSVGEPVRLSAPGCCLFCAGLVNPA